MKLIARDWGGEWATPIVGISDGGKVRVGLIITPKWRDKMTVGVSLSGEVVLTPEGTNEEGISELRKAWRKMNEATI
jgi:hypothetical protein